MSFKKQNMLHNSSYNRFSLKLVLIIIGLFVGFSFSACLTGPKKTNTQKDEYVKRPPGQVKKYKDPYAPKEETKTAIEKKSEVPVEKEEAKVKEKEKEEELTKEEKEKLTGEEDTLTVEETLTKEIIRKKNLNIAVLLPFNADEYYSGTNIPEKSLRVLQLYEGILSGLDMMIR